jgi:hypothetical protein
MSSIETAIGALKSSPIVLALVLLQAATLGAVLYSSMDRQRAVSEQFTHVYALLGECMKSR